MTGYMLAGLIFLGGIGTAVIGELVNLEIRGRLDLPPHFILRIAARRLDPAGKITIYEDEWLPELSYILRGAEARPISRLIVGIKFSAGHVIAAKRTARHLHRTPPDLAQPSPSRVALDHVAEIAQMRAHLQTLTKFREIQSIEHATLSAEMAMAKADLDWAERLIVDSASTEVMGALHDRDSCRDKLEHLRMRLVTSETKVCRITASEVAAASRLAERCRTADQD